MEELEGSKAIIEEWKSLLQTKKKDGTSRQPVKLECIHSALALAVLFNGADPTSFRLHFDPIFM